MCVKTILDPSKFVLKISCMTTLFVSFVKLVCKNYLTLVYKNYCSTLPSPKVAGSCGESGVLINKRFFMVADSYLAH